MHNFRGGKHWFPVFTSPKTVVTILKRIDIPCAMLIHNLFCLAAAYHYVDLAFYRIGGADAM